MSTQSIIQSPDEDRVREFGPRRIRVRRRSAAALAPAQDHAAAPTVASADRSEPDGTRQPGGVGGARILRRWSVADLIARADGAPRAMA
jgi:hypothetical protein